MPGIAGIISNRPSEECQRLVRAMIDCMQYEPFYVSGTCCVPDLGVHGGWVADDGSFAARQSACGERNDGERNDVDLLFSGECFPLFHFSNLPATSQHQGGNHNADELLCLYDEKGDSFVAQLNGLFSGLLIDRRRKRALLFNDRYGIERIYYYQKDGTTYFASEAKALLRIVPELRAFDDEGVAQFLAFGCTLGERTLFRNVRLLSGGSLWIFEGNLPGRKEHYFRPEEWESQPVLSEEAFELELMETFRRILPRYVSSDFPIGISLTGGLDTRMIMACLPELLPKPVCYTFSGLKEETLDARLAARVAKVCGLDHHVLRISTDFLENYGYYVDQTVFITDGGAGALDAHEIYFSTHARLLSKIRLTGNFGSEILRGMSTFKPLNLKAELFDPSFRRIYNKSILNDLFNKTHPVTFAAFQEIPWHIFGIPSIAKSQLTLRTPYLVDEFVSLAYRSPKILRRSSRFALRVVNENNALLGQIPTDRGLTWSSYSAYSIKKIYSQFTFKLDYLHKEGLPNWLYPLNQLIESLSRLGLIGLHKFLPYRRWYMCELIAYLSDIMNSSNTRKRPYWSHRFITSMIENHCRGRKNYTREIHAVLTIEAIDRLLIQSSNNLSVVEKKKV